MRIMLLANAGAIHSIRWANGLASHGVEVHLVSAHRLSHDLDPRVTFHLLPVLAPLGYICSVVSLQRLLKVIEPDLLNAHYATGYGLLARLSRFRPLLLSVWGSDVYDFPVKSKLHRWFLRKNLSAATAIGSTSRCMAAETAKTFQAEHVFITPFGVDEKLFLPVGGARKAGELIIGTVKTLGSKYGIDTLIAAFAHACSAIGDDVDIRLEISGDGPDREELTSLVRRLHIGSKVTFHGWVAHSDVPAMLHRMDIYVALSRLESFGVAILEAGACELPVVVSDADGPVEVTVNGKTGFIVPREDPVAAAEALLVLIRSAQLRKDMGSAGREQVLANYTWEHSIELMIKAYRQVGAIHQRENGAGKLS